MSSHKNQLSSLNKESYGHQNDLQEGDLSSHQINVSSQTEKKSEYIHLRVHHETKALLKENAKKRGISLTQYILDRVMTETNGVITDDMDPGAPAENNVITNDQIDYYKNSCQNLILLLNEFLQQNFPNYILDKLISAIKRHNPELIQKIKEEFIDE